MQSNTGHRWTEDSRNICEASPRALWPINTAEQIWWLEGISGNSVFSQNRAGIIKGSHSFESRDTLSDSKSCNILLEISKVVGMSPTIHLALSPPPNSTNKGRSYVESFQNYYYFSPALRSSDFIGGGQSGIGGFKNSPGMGISSQSLGPLQVWSMQHPCHLRSRFWAPPGEGAAESAFTKIPWGFCT